MAIAPGGYAFTDAQVFYAFGQQRRVSGRVLLAAGQFWNGTLPGGAFRTDLVRSRVSYSVNPRMFFSGLLQYNSTGDSLSTNLRLRWEYSPGSELFVVYTEDLDTDPLRPDRRLALRDRGLVMKINRLFRF